MTDEGQPCSQHFFIKPSPPVRADFSYVRSTRSVLLVAKKFAIINFTLFHRDEIQGVVLNRFGVITKSGQKGRWILIVDLSYPEGKSVNDGIDPEHCSLKYVRVDDVVRRLLQLGLGVEMAKIDGKSAYRIVPVHPEDRSLLGMCWNGDIFVDAALPFGLRSAPKVFNAIADAMEWMANEQGVSALWHYLDDYITCGVAGSNEYAANLSVLKRLCTFLEISLAEDKVEDPAKCLVFLVIEIDTVKGEVRLPGPKLEMLVKRCTRRDLLSIAGKLQHAATVVRSGHSFVRHFLDLSTVVAKPDHYLRLNAGARSDLIWW